MTVVVKVLILFTVLHLVGCLVLKSAHSAYNRGKIAESQYDRITKLTIITGMLIFYILMMLITVVGR